MNSRQPRSSSSIKSISFLWVFLIRDHCSTGPLLYTCMSIRSRSPAPIIEHYCPDHRVSYEIEKLTNIRNHTLCHLHLTCIPPPLGLTCISYRHCRMGKRKTAIMCMKWTDDHTRLGVDLVLQELMLMARHSSTFLSRNICAALIDSHLQSIPCRWWWVGRSVDGQKISKWSYAELTSAETSVIPH